MAYIGQNFNPLDLDIYLKKYRPDAVGYHIPVTTTDGAVNVLAEPVGSYVISDLPERY